MLNEFCIDVHSRSTISSFVFMYASFGDERFWV